VYICRVLCVGIQVCCFRVLSVWRQVWSFRLLCVCGERSLELYDIAFVVTGVEL